MTQPNFDDLNRLRSAALAHGAGSRQWIEFAQAMLDGFPAIYQKAKTMNAQMALLQVENAAGENAQLHLSSLVDQLKAILADCVCSIDHMNKLATKWEPDHSSGEDRRDWALSIKTRNEANQWLETPREQPAT